MNRLKVWVFTVVVVAAAFLALRQATVSRRAEGVTALDARLASAAAHVAASTRALAREAGAAAALVARDERLLAALAAGEAPAPVPARGRRAARPAATPEPLDEAALAGAARDALASAGKALGFELPPGTIAVAGNRQSVARGGEPAPADAEAAALLRGAIEGQPRQGFARVNGALWYAAAAPAGAGAGVVLLAPLGQEWARAVATAAGADVTVSAPDVKPVSTARPAEVPQLQAATKLAGAGDVGRPGDVDVSLGSLKLPRLPQPIAGGAPLRARAVPIEGVKGAFVVVSLAAAGALDPAAAFHWRTLAGLALVLLGGAVLGFLVRPTEPTPQVPEGLHAAAARIERGDFSARAPQLAGKLGTVAAALNRAAELAGPAQAARGAPPVPAATAATGEWYQGPARPAADEPGPARSPLPSPATSPEPLAPAPPPAFAAAAAPEPAPPPPAAAVAAAPAAGLEVDEETHWQQVFQDFLRTRASCGEAAEGLTYERFRQKLEANRAQLAAKYGCRTVRFQVYVKDGKAALKATPVK